MKILSHIEQIFGYRIAQDGNVEAYLDKLSRLGKFDDKKQIDLLVFLLTRLVEVENRIDVLEDEIKLSKEKIAVKSKPQKEAPKTSKLKSPKAS